MTRGGDLFSRLAERSSGTARAVTPRAASRFQDDPSPGHTRYPSGTGAGRGDGDGAGEDEAAEGRPPGWEARARPQAAATTRAEAPDAPPPGSPMRAAPTTAATARPQRGSSVPAAPPATTVPADGAGTRTAGVAPPTGPVLPPVPTMPVRPPSGERPVEPARPGDRQVEVSGAHQPRVPARPRRSSMPEPDPPSSSGTMAGEAAGRRADGHGPPTVVIAIGRVEVRAHLAAPAPTPRREPARAASELALSEYLRGERGPR